MNCLPVRKNIRLAPLNYIGYQRYFLTLCSFRRQNVFSDAGYCLELLALLAAECASRNFSVPAYCHSPRERQSPDWRSARPDPVGTTPNPAGTSAIMRKKLITNDL
jgi:hypothetical protein